MEEHQGFGEFTKKFRDVVDRYRVRNIELLEELVRLVINNACSLFSYGKTANSLKSMGFKVGKSHDQ